MNLGLEGKIFIVGGASRGLGRAVAEALVAEGARTLVVSRDGDAIARAADELGERAHSCAADLGTREGVDAVVAAAAELGVLDGLLVNVGGPPLGSVIEVGDEEWEDAFRLLVGSPVRLVRALLPRIRSGASILFITSSSVRVALPGVGTSSVLRPAVAALAKCLALDGGYVHAVP